MRDKREFDSILQSIDGHPPSEYARLAGDFDFSRYVLHSLRLLPGTGEAREAVAVIHVPQMIAGFPTSLFETPVRRTALEDYLTRRLAAAVDARFRGGALAGMAMPVQVARPGDTILPRSGLIVSPDFVEARVTLRLPVREGRIDAQRAGELFFDHLPAIVADSLLYCFMDEGEVDAFIRRMEDDDAIRQALPRRGLVAFLVEEGPFRISNELVTEIDTPNAGRVRGAGVPTGVTLILGSRADGRLELMRAIAQGVYNREPSRGAARVLTVADAVEVVAEPGRPIQRVDIRPFLRDSRDGDSLLTRECADALESQMASVMEALQAGARTLLVDEASSAPDFLARDPRLDGLRASPPGRYVPLCDRLRWFAGEARVSWVVGADACAAALIPVADTVWLVENRTIRDVTREVRALALEAPRASGSVEWAEADRWICPSSIDAARGRDDAHIQTDGVHQLFFGSSRARLQGVTQLAEEPQTLTIGLILYYAKLHYLDEARTLSELLDLIDEDIAREGLDTITREVRGDLVRPRRFEIAAALNRLECLRVVTRAGGRART